jgi:hypothetical protein
MDWTKFRELVGQTVSRLREADGDPAKVRTAIRRYLNQGTRLGMSPLVLWDYFAVSHPGIVGQAGYSGTRKDAVMAEFERITRETFSEGG